jgi:mRNA-degrading endonuclease toxin of MazEF toxin-antitoxin module
MLGNPPVRHYVLVVSLDSRNVSERVNSVLIVPFGSQGADGPTTLRFEAGETGLPGPSWLKGHFITTLRRSLLGKRLPRPLSAARMRQVTLAIQRAFDPNSPLRNA